MSERQPIIRIDSVSKRFGTSVTAVVDVSLNITEGEFFALLGPSGCGKTTLLRMLAGFEIPSEGRIFIDGQDMQGVSPNRRDVNMVFQSYAVFPHMSVFDNVAYGLRVSGALKSEIQPRVEHALSLVQLHGLGARKPNQLSGGQRQRVALARALVKRPKVLLLDEPLSALDAKLREAMQLELVRLQKTVGITFVIVTHDQDEALSMADRIAVMNAGRVCQVAEPAELYESPNSRFVADFIGKMNLFEGRVSPSFQADARIEIVGLNGLTLPAPEGSPQEVGVAVRPEKVRVARSRPPGNGMAVRARLETVAYHGSESRLYLVTESGTSVGATLQNSTRAFQVPAPGELVWVYWDADDMIVISD